MPTSPPSHYHHQRRRLKSILRRRHREREHAVAATKRKRVRFTRRQPKVMEFEAQGKLERYPKDRAPPEPITGYRLCKAKYPTYAEMEKMYADLANEVENGKMLPRQKKAVREELDEIRRAMKQILEGQKRKW